MIVPSPPRITELPHISPSIYESSLICKAKATWHALGDHKAIPPHPAALLGMCFHSVLATAHNGQLASELDEAREAARNLFDKRAKALHKSSHPLLHVKFPSVNHLPYYNVYRERATTRSVRILSSHEALGPVQSPPKKHNKPRRKGTEVTLTSSDSLLVGRPDYIDGTKSEVIDYKAGIEAGKVEGLSDSETRQLRLYVHLGLENDISIYKGAIIRGNGRRYEIKVSASEAAAEAERAKHQLHELNVLAAAGKRFEEVAEPSKSNCRTCPCIPFCDAFWANAEPSWSDDSGVHLEGVVTGATTTDFKESSIVTLQVEVNKGTVEPGLVLIEQVPEAWTMLEEDEPAKPGDVIRVVDARLPSKDPSTRVRVDRSVTTVWSVPTRK